MKVFIFSLSALLLAQGCETVYHRNTVYQYDTDIASEDSQSCVEGMAPYEWDALMCTEYGEKDLAAGGIETGYCCVWLEDTCETDPCIPMLCQHNLCFWESSCSWELISTTCG